MRRRRRRAVGSLGSGSPARSPPRGGGRRADHLLRFTSDRDRPSKPAPRPKARPHKAFRAKGIAFEQASAHLLVDAPACSPLVADADCAPDWADVVALDVFGGEYVCLDAARMPVAARCGHVFCGPCVVRHAKMDDVSRSARCPCCGGPLRVGDLRPCRVRQRDAPPAAAKRAIELVLLRRPRSARAPRAHCERDDGDLCEPLGKLTACDGAAFDRAWARRRRRRAAAAAADDSVERRDVAVAVEALAAVRAAAASRPRDAFLHPLFLKLLLAAAGGDSDALPRTLTATVSHVERVEQTEEARKRFPWAAHVPLGTDFALLDATKIAGDGDDAWAKRCADARRADEGLDAGLRERADAVRKERDRAKREEKRHAKHGEALLPKKVDPFAYSRSDFGRLSSEAVPIPGAGASAATTTTTPTTATAPRPRRRSGRRRTRCPSRRP
ncbi:ubiquitin-like protein transferase [Aureococcus anophagefferens]|nr:ubiquitin-like protein transferase [Aureococcus anophagefferens]